MGECIVLSVSTLYAVLEREVLLKFATGKDQDNTGSLIIFQI